MTICQIRNESAGAFRPRFKFGPWIAHHKFIFDQGAGHAFGVINYVLFLIVASDKIQTFLGITKTRWFLALAIPGGIVVVYLFSWLLERKRFFHLYTDECNKRNEILQGMKK